MITVFTPIYNRAYIIEQLFNSLLNQTNHNFEWVIINDGSTDNINELVEDWKNMVLPFVIKFKTVTNHGKHVAINHGVDMACGDLFFIVDSDDYLLPNAIELIYSKLKDLPKEGFAGLSFNRGFSNNKLIGKTFKGEYIDATALERRKYHILGDKAEIYFTKVLKNYPFFKFEDENFLTEISVWYKIANDGYKIRWFNDIIYICEYLPDGLTKNKDLTLNNFQGYTHTVKELLTYRVNIIDKVKSLGNYAFVAKRKGLTISQGIRAVNAQPSLYLFSLVLYSGYRTILSLRQKT